ncbi:MAG: hypothetical protein Q9210_004050 [Variospora velana]
MARSITTSKPSISATWAGSTLIRPIYGSTYRWRGPNATSILLAVLPRSSSKGDFRWAAEILNHAVFVKPDYTSATSLLADTYEQLGYGAENGTWRSFFISGTTELRTGNFGTPTQTASDDVIAQLTPEMLFDAFAIQINGPEAWGQEISIKAVLTDGPCYRWWLSNGAFMRGFDPAKLKEVGIDVSGDISALDRLAALLDRRLKVLYENLKTLLSRVLVAWPSAIEASSSCSDPSGLGGASSSNSTVLPSRTLELA